jgi:glycosyltransferase involved in cell wall biosynthesis
VSWVLAVSRRAPPRDELAASARVVAVERADDVVPLMWAADALAMPSRGEGLSFTQLEAAATGLAVVASDLPALREGGDARALFFPPEDANALADALRAALASPRATDLPPSEDDGVSRWAARIIALYA